MQKVSVKKNQTTSHPAQGILQNPLVSELIDLLPEFKEKLKSAYYTKAHYFGSAPVGENRSAPLNIKIGSQAWKIQQYNINNIEKEALCKLSLKERNSIYIQFTLQYVLRSWSIASAHRKDCNMDALFELSLTQLMNAWLSSKNLTYNHISYETVKSGIKRALRLLEARDILTIARGTYGYVSLFSFNSYVRTNHRAKLELLNWAKHSPVTSELCERLLPSEYKQMMQRAKAIQNEYAVDFSSIKSIRDSTKEITSNKNKLYYGLIKSVINTYRSYQNQMHPLIVFNNPNPGSKDPVLELIKLKDQLKADLMNLFEDYESEAGALNDISVENYTKRQHLENEPMRKAWAVAFKELRANQYKENEKYYNLRSRDAVSIYKEWRQKAKERKVEQAKEAALTPKEREIRKLSLEMSRYQQEREYLTDSGSRNNPRQWELDELISERWEKIKKLKLGLSTDKKSNDDFVLKEPGLHNEPWGKRCTMDSKPVAILDLISKKTKNSAEETKQMAIQLHERLQQAKQKLSNGQTTDQDMQELFKMLEQAKLLNRNGMKTSKSSGLDLRRRSISRSGNALKNEKPT